MIGSYDDSPGESNFLSQYKNLAHHYVHQHARQDAFTFWGACGAIRRAAFLESGGFDERFTRTSVEDIELGSRLKACGHRILLCKLLQVKHLKRWTIRSLVKTDFLDRALPWSRMIVRGSGFSDDLNIARNSRVSVTLCYAALVSLSVSPLHAGSLVLALVLSLLNLLLNFGLYRFFLLKRGLIFAIGAVAWHWFYFAYSGAAFGIEFLRFRLAR